MAKLRTILYFGSFNPVHKGHIALGEWMLDRDLCDQVILIVSPQNPLKQASDLAPEFNRYEMCQIACACSRYPEKIMASAVEFTLDRPSYTINTLRYLKRNFGAQMSFSILMGADNILSIEKWKSWERIISDFDIYVYPRDGYEPQTIYPRVKMLEDAPRLTLASTHIRAALLRRESILEYVCQGVGEYIRSHSLYSPAEKMGQLGKAIEAEPSNTTLRMERAKLCMQQKLYRKAIDDLSEILRLEPQNHEAGMSLSVIEEILRK